MDEAGNADVIASVGGDGVFLQAVRHTGLRENCLYVGVTQGDDSGLYCDFQLDNFEDMLQAMVREEMQSGISSI